MKTAIVQVPAAFLYETEEFANPEDAYGRVADEIFMGWAVKILEERDGVCRVVSHYGYQGYMEAGLLRRISPEELSRREERGRLFCLKERLTDVMEIPAVQGRVLCALTRGCFLTVLPEKKDGYQRVRLADGREGYVPEKGLTKRLDTDRYLYREGWDFHSQNLPEGPEREQFRKRVTETALSYLGTQYRWGGKSAQGIDCSGMAFMSYLLNGLLIYRDASIQKEYPIRKIPVENVRPGDLLFFPGHVAVYLGEGKYVHSTGARNSFGCVINSLNPEDADYRKDLREKLTAAGSIDI